MPAREGAYIPPSGGTGRDVAPHALAVAAVILRLCAYLAVLVVVVGCFGGVARIPHLGSATSFLMSLTPPSLLGLLSIRTPFGGLFRGDFALLACALFFLDWLCLRIRSSLR